jgi:hypothetical protein
MDNSCKNQGNSQCSSSPHAASVCVRSFLICTAVTETSVAQASDTIIDYHLLPTMMSRMGTTNKGGGSGQPTDRQTDRPTDRLTNRPMDQLTHRPTKQPITD